MAQPAFDPSKPFTVVGAPPPPVTNPNEPRIGVDPVRGFLAQKDPESVTLGDLMENPGESMRKIGASLKRDATNPKVWLALAASYFGPKAYRMAAPVVARAVDAASRLRVAPGKAAESFGPTRVLARSVYVEPPTPEATVPGFQRYMPNTGSATPAPSAAPPAAPAAASPAPPVPPVARAPRTSAPQPPPAASQLARMKGALTDEEALAVDGLVRQGVAREDALAAVQHYRATSGAAAPAPSPAPPSQRAPAAPKPVGKFPATKAEATEYQRLLSRGMSDADAKALVVQQRQFVASTGLPSPAKAERTRNARNRTGRWPKSE